MKIMLSGGAFKGNRRGMLLTSFLFVCVFAAAAFWIFSSFKQVFEEKAAVAAKIKAVKVINDAAEQVFSGADTQNLLRISRNEKEMITSVSTDTAKLNRIRAELSVKLAEYAEKENDTTVYIPAGSLTKFAVLQGVGMKIPVKVALDGFYEIDFNDKFESAGINRVRHKIYMTASVNISAISAVMAKKETVTTEIPLSETVFAGEVPQYYGDGINIAGR